jgi:quinate dehydrogenase (quinone)
MNHSAAAWSARVGWRLAIRVFSVIVLLIGLALALGGVRLALLGGSVYYVIAGAGLVAASVLLWRQRVAGVGVLLVVFAGSIAWALWEAGIAFWPLFARLLSPALLVLLALLLAPHLQGSSDSRSLRKRSYPAAALLVVCLLGVLYLVFQPQGVVEAANGGRGFTASSGQAQASDWAHYGRTPAGTRFAPFGQITRENVAQLELAWTFQSGDLSPGEDQNTPLQIGDMIYTCSRTNRIAALDADTGAVRWQFDPKAKSPVWQRCRGLAYHSAADGVAPRACNRRIIQTTIDARLIALDAATGVLCEGFGDKGTVDLSQHMGPFPAGFYFQTSAPTVARNRIVVGGWVADNQARGEPSGVIRAFDVNTGALIWAWDLGNPAITREPPPGQTYTRGTPNMWSTPSYDDALGLLYVPLGNATPDYYGEGRSPESERYASSVVALDIETGRDRWHFQTVHHDLWDYDIASQPALYELPDGKGGTIPAMLLTTKRGQLFFLNRANGQPLSEVKELPVPQTGQAPGEWLAKTQPYSVAMPGIGSEVLSEAKMWGMTPLDQLWCRIRFRSLLYEGDFTPPSLGGSIQFPGNTGGLNWGSVALDADNGVAFMNDIRMPTIVRLMPPEEARVRIAAHKGPPSGHGMPALQEGTPYGVSVDLMVSPLFLPCLQPPSGTLTAVDLKHRRIAWQVPMGTAMDSGPFGTRTHLPVPVGMPTMGGPISTASGLVFFAGTQDFYLRALDAATGKELWRQRLPVGVGGTPITYVSPKSGRQYVLVSAGGARGSRTRGDYVMAFALPNGAAR